MDSLRYEDCLLIILVFMHQCDHVIACEVFHADGTRQFRFTLEAPIDIKKIRIYYLLLFLIDTQQQHFVFWDLSISCLFFPNGLERLNFDSSETQDIDFSFELLIIFYALNFW